MPPSLDPCGSVRSADEVNRQIRALWPHADARLTDGQRREYEQLVTEWAAAVRSGVVEAA